MIVFLLVCSKFLTCYAVIGLHTPTEVQSSVIPRLISTETTKGENLVLSAGTGSGKIYVTMQFVVK